MCAVSVARLADPRRTAPTARVLTSSASGTELSLHGTDGERLQVRDEPDAAGARRVARLLDRILWQRLEVRDGTVTGVVAGTRRRRPAHVRVDGPAALGLVVAGVPTVVRRVDRP
jgi:hypothetical protein